MNNETQEITDRRCRDNLTPAQRAEIGKKGGLATSLNRQHMSEIGRKGGVKVASDRSHMAEIGRIGGSKRGKSRQTA